MTSTNPEQQLAALEAFATAMGAWVTQNVPEGHFADDDRESIYEGRGE